MRPITTLARPLVAAPYIITGLETLRDPRRRAEQVGPAIKPITDQLDWLPTKDPETLVRVEGAISLTTGMLLMAGRFQRLTMAMAAAQLIPALAAEHRYWTEDDPERRASERSHLLKNASLLGALLMVATEPRRSASTADVRRAVKEARSQAGAQTKAMRRDNAAELKSIRREAARQIRDARRRRAMDAALTYKVAMAGAAAKTGKAAGMAKTTGMGKAYGMGKAAGTARTAGMAKAAGMGKTAGMAKMAGMAKAAEMAKAAGMGRSSGKGKAAWMNAAWMNKAAGMGKAPMFGRKKRRGRMAGMMPMAQIAQAARPASAKASMAGTKAATAVKQRSRQAAMAMKH